MIDYKLLHDQWEKLNAVIHRHDPYYNEKVSGEVTGLEIEALKGIRGMVEATLEQAESDGLFVYPTDEF